MVDEISTVESCRGVLMGRNPLICVAARVVKNSPRFLKGILPISPTSTRASSL